LQRVNIVNRINLTQFLQNMHKNWFQKLHQLQISISDNQTSDEFFKNTKIILQNAKMLKVLHIATDIHYNVKLVVFCKPGRQKFVQNVRSLVKIWYEKEDKNGALQLIIEPRVDLHQIYRIDRLEHDIQTELCNITSNLHIQICKCTSQSDCVLSFDSHNAHLFDIHLGTAAMHIQCVLK
jgi:hypothetical protein